jgi:glucokinase
MILAGDIGATKSLIGLFEPAPGSRRPTLHHVESFPTTEFDGLPSILRTYLEKRQSRPEIVAASFGVAGPVIGQRAQMTNVDWSVSADEVKNAMGVARVRLLNDLEAMAYAVPVLEPGELSTLQAGMPRLDGNAVLIAAGTGMGQSILHRVDGALLPIPTEGGHVDFAARTDREWELMRYLRERLGRVDLENVVSGLGLVNIARFTHGGDSCPVAGGLDPDDRKVPKRISADAMERTCAHCVEAMEIFVGAYGAAAGNLALQAVAGAGVYIGGGIAPGILPLLTDGRFLQAFAAKPPMEDFLARVPVHVILNRDVGILGAAVAASQ